MKAIIGGTGVDSLPGFTSKRVEVKTPYGEVELFLGTGKDSFLVFLPRHGSLHSTPPHLINYRSNISALKELGVDEVICIYAVGSVSDRLKPGEVGVLSDFVDFTGGGRQHTFFTGGEQKVQHSSMDKVFDAALSEKLVARNSSLKQAGVYVCTNGPRLETPAEIRFFKAMGFDVVGMTCATEVGLAREAGMKVAALAYSINWAAGVGVENEVVFIDDVAIATLRDAMTTLCIEVLGG